ncbi:MAG: MotA/TolQ/ExbB proton channel family protein, partial [Myxococcota bacterium]
RWLQICGDKRMNTENLVEHLMGLPLFESAWVLWLLIAMSVLSIGIVVERLVFFFRHRVDGELLVFNLDQKLGELDFDGAAKMLAKHDSFESNVALNGLRHFERGPEAVQELLTRGERKERGRFARFLPGLATIGSTAPFIGLFGTVLGIIRAFQDMSMDMAGGASTVMGGISEALIATAIGLLVAIPALIAYNAFSSALKNRQATADQLARTLLSHLKSDALIVSGEGA